MRFSTSFLSILIPVILFVNCSGNRQDSGSSAGSDQLYKPGSGKLVISGAYGLYPTALRWADAYMAEFPGAEIQVGSGGTGKGIEDLSGGVADLAMISRELTKAEKELGLIQIPVTKDAVGLVVNAGNPFLETIMDTGMDPRLLKDLYSSGGEFTWGRLLGTEAGEIVGALVREDVSGTEEVWANYLFLKGEELQGLAVKGDDNMLEAIRADRYAIGFINLAYVFNPETGKPAEGVQLIPIDTDMDGSVDKAEQTFDSCDKMHRAIWLGLYPKNLCRRMSFVSRGTPEDPLAVHFLKWVLHDGQKMTEKTGCCEFNHVEIQHSLEAIGL